MKDITKHYKSEEISIVWKPALCTHSTNCWKGLPKVFHPKQLPWITPEHADTPTLINQVNQCPSGALSWIKHEQDPSLSTETNG